MATKLVNACKLAGLMLIAGAAFAGPLRAEGPWAPETFEMSIASTAAFSGMGIVLAIVGFKLFDLVTPGKLDQEICEKQNVAAGILGGAVVLGICIIIASVVA